MLATDLAARGLDIKGLQYVVNYELPTKMTRYIHRVGRTARAGESGVSITLVNEDEFQKIKTIVKKTKDKLYRRKVARNSVQECSEMISEREQDIEDIVDQEKVEREIRLANIDMEKAQNLIKYKEEIYRKPKKNWFQSNRFKNIQKEEAKKVALEEDF